MTDPSDIRLEMTCMACPEQYDAFLGDRLVGYIRLRFGVLRVEARHPEDATLYRFEFPGDPLKGMFESDQERDHFLNLAKKKIADSIQS